jgi:PadR family transcriptional regulator AphA
MAVGIKAKAALTPTEYAVLGMLGDLGRPASGYDLRKAIDQSVGLIWGPSKTQLYTVLGRLVESGLLNRQVVEQRERPDKHLYEVTRAGRSALRQWLARDEDYRDLQRASDIVLLKTFLGRQGDRRAIVRQLAALRDAYAARLSTYDAIWQRRRPRRNDYAGLALQFGMLRARAAVEWVENALHELSGG